MFPTAYMINDSITTIQKNNKHAIRMFVHDESLSTSFSNMVDAQTECITKTLSQCVTVVDHFKRQWSKPNNTFDPLTSFGNITESIAKLVKPKL